MGPFIMASSGAALARASIVYKSECIQDGPPSTGRNFPHLRTPDALFPGAANCRCTQCQEKAGSGPDPTIRHHFLTSNAPASKPAATAPASAARHSLPPATQRTPRTHAPGAPVSSAPAGNPSAGTDPAGTPPPFPSADTHASPAPTPVPIPGRSR